MTGGEKSEIYDPGRGDVVDTVPLASEDDMMAGMVAATEAYNVGDKLDEATDMGPLINEAAAENVERMDGMPFGGVKGTGRHRVRHSRDDRAQGGLPHQAWLITAQRHPYWPMPSIWWHSAQVAMKSP